MATLTLLQIRQRAAKRADVEVEDDGRHDTDDVNAEINASIVEYHALHAQYGLAIELQTTVTTTASTAVVGGIPSNQYVSLPAGIIKVRALRIQTSGYFLPLLPYAELDPDVDFSQTTTPCQYKLGTDSSGALIARLYPPANGAYPIRVIYVPGATPLEDDSDSYTFIDGTEDYVICDVALKLLESDGNPEPSQTNSLNQRKADAERHLQQFTGRLDAVAPPTMVTRRR